MNIVMSVTDILECRKQYQEEYDQLKEKLLNTGNEILFNVTKHRMDVLEALIDFIDKLLGEK